MSKPIIKNFDDISKIKKACEIWKITKKEIIKNIKVGVSLLELDSIAKQSIESLDAKPTFYKQYGFPQNICISVNQCVIHGVPNNYELKDGDLVTFDIGVTYQNHICDAAFSYIVGINQQAQDISDTALNAIYVCLQDFKPNITTNLDLAKKIENYVHSKGYKILHDFSGHGCGNQLHEPPCIPNYYDPLFEKQTLKPNMVICIEPMILSESNEYFIDPFDQWSVIAKNNKLTCHWEHMVLITETGFEILTND